MNDLWWISEPHDVEWRRDPPDVVCWTITLPWPWFPPPWSTASTGSGAYPTYTGALKWIEIWDDIEFSTGGQRVGMIPLTEVVKAQDYLEINGDERFSITVPASAPYTSELDHGRVLRCQYGDEGVIEWRIRRMDWTRDNDGGKTLDIDAYGIKHDLATNSELVQFLLPATTQPDAETQLHHELLQLTIAQHLTHIDDWWPSYFVAGTVSSGLSTKHFDLVYDWDTPYSAIQELAVMANAEWFVTRNSSGTFSVSFSTQINSTAPTPIIAYGKSQLRAKRSEDSIEQATRVYVKGGGEPGWEATLADCLWQSIEGNSASTKHRITHMLSIEDDQLAGMYVKDSLGNFYQIAGSFSTVYGAEDLVTTALLFSSGVNLYANTKGWLQLCDNVNGRPLNYVSSPSAEATYGIRPMVLERTDLPAVNNFLPDALCEVYTGAWLDVGSPTVQLISTPSPYVRYGTKCFKVTASAGEGISNTVSMPGEAPTPSSREPHYSCQAMITAVSGKARLEMSCVGTTATHLYPPSSQEVARTEALEAPTHIAVAPGAENLFDLGVNQITVKIVADSTAAVFYVDAAQLTRTAAPKEQIVRGQPNARRGGLWMQQLWTDAMNTLQKSLAPAMEYDTDAIDLQRIAPVIYGADAFVLGGKVRMLDEGIGLDSTRRVYSMRRDLKIVGNSRLEFEP